MPGKTLIIAEKPDMGRNIAAAIEPRARNMRTHIIGQHYIITWAIGHLVTLAEPDKYEDRYKKWRFQDLPIIPDSFQLIPNPKTKDQLKVIKELAKECGEIVNACDAGREGQYIFSLIQRYLRLSHPVKRLWISDLTPETIQQGFAQLRDGSDFDNLTKAARARSEADWLIGMNGSRAFTTKHQVLLSVGRVQTPVLALIYDRQKEIEQFSSKTFFHVQATFRQQDTVYRGLWQGDPLSDRKQAEQIAAKTANKPARIQQYDKQDKREYPFKLYDLTLLQREANAKYGLSAKKTLDLAQSLYEKHKVISYPRTSSNYVTEQNIPEMHKALSALKATDYRPLVEQAKAGIVHVGNKRICNAAKVDDHHAILPTAKKAGALSTDEQKIYDLVVRRFLSQFYPPAQYLMHTVWTEVEKEMFKTTVKEQQELGWKVVYENETRRKAQSKKQSSSTDNDTSEDTEEEETATPFQLNESAPVHSEQTEVKEKQTQPPKPYTEGTLLKAMESAGKQIEDEELRDVMKEAGLGTPATRAATIERLKAVGYVQMKGKRIDITQKGSMTVEVIRGAGIHLLTSPEMTGHWERRLNEIARGKAQDSQFMDKVKEFTTHIIQKVGAQSKVEATAFGEEAGSRGKGKGKRTRSRTTSSPSARKSGQTAATNQSTDQTSRKQTSGGPSSPSSSKSGDHLSPLAPCPRPSCGGTIIQGKKGFGCTHYKRGCRFVIWKKSFNKTLTTAMISRLIEKGSTNKLKFKHEDGTEFQGKLILVDVHTGGLKIDAVD
ncbi:type IA DNA topoisomerase [Marinicrinis sediminis]|uniref:DNA topoisomerase n=1 Tax=Marinicrinis sediminis TaxID=1652465 RepID=A0ABW5REX7_9BACL